MIMATKRNAGIFRFLCDVPCNLQADYIALSFVQCAADIVECRTALRGNCCG